jgi:signal transduction histidine kinase/ActR/RegA family two-component response regulator
MDSVPHILAAQTRLLHQQAPPSQIGGLAVALFIWFVFWPSISPNLTLSWMSAIIAVTLIRYWLWWYFKRHLHNDELILVFRVLITAMLFLSGVIWAVGSWIFFLPDDPILIGVLIAVYACLIAGAIGSLAPDLRAYVAYATPIAIAFALRLLIEEHLFTIIVPLAFLFFCFICVLYARNMQATIVDSIKLRIQNETLIQELRSKSEELTQEAARAEAANESKSRFLAVASHDLAQPMHALELFMTALRRETDQDKTRKLIDSASRSTSMLSEMFASLLDLSKLEKGSVDPQLSEFDIAEILNPLITEFRSRSESKGLSFYADVEPLIVRTDPGLLQRVVLNLMSNALKHTETGSITLNVTSVEAQLKISIIDTGIGISPEDQADIFNEYYQSDPNSTEGMGIGLYVVAQIIDILGASINLTSTQGEGSQFEVLLALAEQKQSNETLAVAEDQDFSKLVVIFVDDMAEGIEAMTSIFSQWGCTYYCGGDLPEIYAQVDLRTSRPDIIICDYRLAGGRTGLTVRDEVREQIGEVPFLLITGETSSSRLQEFSDANVDYLLKPTNINTLESRIIELTRKT